MARTKQTKRKEGHGPPLAKVATAGKGKRSRKGKPQHLFKQKATRVKANINALREIRKAQKVTTLCILKAPFRRMVREISDLCKDNMRWYTTALDCIHFAAEDYLIEFFVDAILLAAHAHRVTLMIRDTNSLNMLRHRMNMLVHPIDFVDKKMRDILMVPPARKPKDTIVITEITEEDLHERDTRENALKRELLERQVGNRIEVKRKRIQTELERKQKGRIEIEQENYDLREAGLIAAIESLKPKANVLIKDEAEYIREMDNQDLSILQNPLREVSDDILFIALR